MMHDPLTERIIGCAYRVYNTLGSGFLENVYKNALCFELGKSGLSVEAEYPIDVTYDGQKVGSFFCDIQVDRLVIVELKAVDSLSKVHEIQLVNYLKATGIKTGLLINFGKDGIQIRRKYRDPVHPVILSDSSTEFKDEFK